MRGDIFICSYVIFVGLFVCAISLPQLRQEPFLFVHMLFLLVCLSNFIATVEVAVNPKRCFLMFSWRFFCCCCFDL